MTVVADSGIVDVQADCTLVEGLQEAFLPLCRLDIELQSKCSLPHMNAKKGILESRNGSGLRCSCCSGEFLFSFVCLVKRKGVPSLIWLSRFVHQDSAISSHIQNGDFHGLFKTP